MGDHISLIFAAFYCSYFHFRNTAVKYKAATGKFPIFTREVVKLHPLLFYLFSFALPLYFLSFVPCRLPVRMPFLLFYDAPDRHP